MRLAKHLAHAGVASRRGAEEVIGQGRVAVNGTVVTDPARDVGEKDLVEVDGRALKGAELRVVYVLNKPVGVLSTARDTHGRPTVVDLLADVAGGRGGAYSGRSDDAGPGTARGRAGDPRPGGPRLYPVGRLDADTSGLILLTNDGALANLLTHPRYEVPKTYVARVAGGPVGARALRALRAGVDLDDGPTAPAHVVVRWTDTLEITIAEGRNRQVRRMCEAVGHPVISLRRIAFGPLRLGRLAPGSHRRLSEVEVERLRGAARGE